jgi:DNA mismatch repair ATPase MutS
MLAKELDDDYFSLVQTHLQKLAFRDGVLISARLGTGNKGLDYTLRTPNPRSRKWVQRILEHKPPVHSFTIADRDESGAKALAEMRDLGINLVSNALAQSADHIRSFFSMLRTELAFYICCINLHGRLLQLGEPVCFPRATASSERRHTCKGVYDVCLALRMQRKVVSNDLDADGQTLVVVTGANQGGKSTFLRSVGLAQLMMQCGMFVPADSYVSSMFDLVFTHYKREEDKSMTRGKLDEELKRMSRIADYITPNSLLLLNESFAATNEREGSEIARQIVFALRERGINIVFVTHLYEFARRLLDERAEDVLFLSAERRDDGQRTFRIVPRQPLSTSFGPDLYYRVFGSGEAMTKNEGSNALVTKKRS